jgi:hypothetical protein
MAKMWDFRRREMDIQSEREKRKKTGNRIFQQKVPYALYTAYPSGKSPAQMSRRNFLIDSIHGVSTSHLCIILLP